MDPVEAVTESSDCCATSPRRSRWHRGARATVAADPGPRTQNPGWVVAPFGAYEQWPAVAEVSRPVLACEAGDGVPGVAFRAAFRGAVVERAVVGEERGRLGVG